jgi:hypothetical protein
LKFFHNLAFLSIRAESFMSPMNGKATAQGSPLSDGQRNLKRNSVGRFLISWAISLKADRKGIGFQLT